MVFHRRDCAGHKLSLVKQVFMAQTRVNLDFPAQDQAFSDTVTFSILAKTKKQLQFQLQLILGLLMDGMQRARFS